MYVGLLPFQLKALNEQIALLSDYKVTADSVVSSQELIIEGLEFAVLNLLEAVELNTQTIKNMDEMLGIKDMQLKNNKKKSARTTIYTAIGCVGLGGVLTFILMR
jgi:hypothetical protein